MYTLFYVLNEISQCEHFKVRLTLILISMETITWQDFEKVELRAGTIIEINDFPRCITSVAVLRRKNRLLIGFVV